MLSYYISLVLYDIMPQKPIWHNLCYAIKILRLCKCLIEPFNFMQAIINSFLMLIRIILMFVTCMHIVYKYYAVQFKAT